MSTNLHTDAKPTILNLVQGSPEWLAARFDYGTASEASAMLGCNLYGVTRTALLDAKKLRSVEEPTPAEQFIFDRGHKAEELARPKVEAMLDEDLNRRTLSRIVEGVPLLASYDGLTMLFDTSWENKLRNKDLVAIIEAGDISKLDKHYRAQLEQQLLVAGAERAFFSIGDDNEASEPVGLWYESDAALRAEIIAGWRLFFQDLETHVVKEKVAAVVAAPVKHLPTLFVQAKGEITATNLPEFVVVATEFLDGINKTPANDQEFADAKALAAKMREAAKAITAQVDAMLAQSASLAEAKLTMENLADRFNKDALVLEKAVTAEEANRKTRMQTEAQTKLAAYVATLNERLKREYMPKVHADFAAAIKGIRKVENMQAAVDATLANAKLEANAIADRIEFNLRAMGDNEHLFPDLRAVCTKERDDFAALLAARLAAEATVAAAKAAQAAAAPAQAVAAPATAELKAVPNTPPPITETVAAPSPPTNVEQLRQAVIDHEAGIRAFLDFKQPPEALRNTIRAYLVEYERWKASNALKKAA